MKTRILLCLFIGAYITYFSIFSVIRYRTLYSSYFDLGIMHQTVYNTYNAVKTQDFSRFLELTNPYGSDQIKRIAIHNDLILAFLSPFYFIHAGPETLLVIQTVILALGAIPIFLLAEYEFRKYKSGSWTALLFAFAYLLYTPLERANIFDFHGVTLATTFLLFMFYLWFIGRKGWSFIFLVLSLLTKEQIGLTTSVFGAYAVYSAYKLEKGTVRKYIFGVLVMIVSFAWSLLSISYLIPYFRGATHFALKYYKEFGNTPITIVIGMFEKPIVILKSIFNPESFNYLLFVIGPIGFFAVLSPSIIIALPEFGINLLSKNGNMQNIFFHYTSVITPFIFIASIFGAKKFGEWLKRRVEFSPLIMISAIISLFTVYFAYVNGPLPFTRAQEIHPFKYPQKEIKDVELWADTLQSEKIKVASTGQLAPFFTSRRYFYNFSGNYFLADYVVLRITEITEYPEKKELVPIYKKLQNDPGFDLIYKSKNFEVYKKLKPVK